MDAIYVPINFRAKTEELEQILTIAQPSMLFLGERYLPLAPLSGDAALPADRVVVLDGEGPPGEGYQNILSYDQLVSGVDAEEMHFPQAEDDDTTVIMFTAGTTGVPKGVMLTHDSFASFLLSTLNPRRPRGGKKPTCWPCLCTTLPDCRRRWRRCTAAERWW